MKPLSDDKKLLIIEARQSGKSLREIATTFHLSHMGVKKIINKFNQTQSVKNLPKSGRPQLTSSHTNRLICREAQKNPKTSSRQIKESLNLDISSRTVRRRLNAMNIHSFIAKKKPFLRKPNIKKRLDFARKFINMPDAFWDRVFWTDESKFELFNTKRRERVWCQPQQRLNIKCIQSTVKHGGGNIMVWGGFTSCGVGNLVRIHEKLTGAGYVNILKENLASSLHKLGINKFVLMQDNDPKHTAKVSKQYLASSNIEVLDWPPQSPDLNPIENLWAILDEKIPIDSRKNKDEFFESLRKAWELVPQQTLNHLVRSMPKRLAAVIENKGGHINY